MKQLNNQGVENTNNSRANNKKSRVKLVVFALAITFYAFFAYVFGNESICIFKVYAGLPCPGCGMTRAFISLFQGNINQAFYWHPLWPLVVIGPAIYAYFDKRGNGHKEKNILIWILFAIFVSTYAYRMYLYFPEQAPMDFNKHSYFYQIYEHVVIF